MKAQSKTIKTIITSNSWPARRALCTLLLSIAALWARPGSVRAQLYVCQSGSTLFGGSVGEYNATTGAAINANFIAGLVEPSTLALSGDNLFVVNDYSNNATIGEYNAITGAAINVKFIAGVSYPFGLALSGNNLFVANGSIVVNGRVEGSNTVGTYNAATGTAINANFVTGLNGSPSGLALSGNILFVANQNLGTVGEYDATTGDAINADFIAGLDIPVGLALSGNNLFVANYGNGAVGEYNATTGAAINANFITGLSEPAGLALSGDDLFVANYDGNYIGGAVGEYDATTGAAINANFVSGLRGPTGLAIAPVPEPSTWAMIAMGGGALLGIRHRKKHCTP